MEFTGTMHDKVSINIRGGEMEVHYWKCLILYVKGSNYTVTVKMFTINRKATTKTAHQRVNKPIKEIKWSH